MQEKKENKISLFIDNLVDFFFSKNPKKWIVLILILGIILRFWIVPNITPQVADEMVHGPHAIGVISSGALNMQNQCPIWFYLTDIAYEIFGVNSFSMRFLSIFFGILLIPLIYLISRKFFNTKIALIASFLWAISSYVIRYSLGEMDIAMIFFVMLAIYFFFDSYIEKQKLSLWVFVFLSVAILIKPIALMFIPGFIILFFIKSYKKRDILKQNLKNVIYGSILSLIFMSPVLVYNYLLYNEKQITDVLFSRFLHISPEIFEQLQGFDVTFSIMRIIKDGPWFLWHTFPLLNPVISLLGILGIILILFYKNQNAKLFLLPWIIPFIFLLGTSHLQTHFVIFMIPLCIFAGFFILKLLRLLKKGNNKKLLFFILIILFLMNMYTLFPWMTSKSAIFKMRSFAIDNFEDDDIIVADGRIYRGRISFMFHDKHYVESSYFSQIIQQINSLDQSHNIPIDIYYVECVPDDCGWGTIKDQPDFNQSMEQMTSYFSSISKIISSIPGGGNDRRVEEGEPFFNIYHTSANINPAIFSIVDSTHTWFYYPVMWKGDRYDSYELNTIFKTFLHNFAYIILWIAILIAIFSSVIPFIELKRK